MKFKLENIKVNVAEEVQFELGKLEVEYSLEEMVEMGQTLREVIQQIDQLMETAKDTPEEKEEEEPNTQMQNLFDSFAKIYSDDKNKETTESN